MSTPCVVHGRCNRSINVQISSSRPAQSKVVSLGTTTNGEARNTPRARRKTRGRKLPQPESRYLVVRCRTRPSGPMMLNCKLMKFWRGKVKVFREMDGGGRLRRRNCNQFFKNYTVKYLSPAAACRMVFSRGAHRLVCLLTAFLLLRNRFTIAPNMGNGLKTVTNFQSFEIVIFEVISNYHNLKHLRTYGSHRPWTHEFQPFHIRRVKWYHFWSFFPLINVRTSKTRRTMENEFEVWQNCE